MSDHETPEYDSFLTDLQAVVAERVEELRARQSAETPPAFKENDKVVRGWPEMAGRVMEEVR